jgi:hypothetical protein
MLGWPVMVACLLAVSLGHRPMQPMQPMQSMQPMQQQQPMQQLTEFTDLTELGELRSPWPRTWMTGLLQPLIQRTWDMGVSLLLEAKRHIQMLKLARQGAYWSQATFIHFSMTAINTFECPFTAFLLTHCQIPRGK